MKAHVQNPNTRSPGLMVYMTVEEVQQAYLGLDRLSASALLDLQPNQGDALLTLLRELRHALTTALPRGLKGATP